MLFIRMDFLNRVFCRWKSCLLIGFSFFGKFFANSGSPFGVLIMASEFVEDV